MPGDVQVSAAGAGHHGDLRPARRVGIRSLEEADVARHMGPNPTPPPKGQAAPVQLTSAERGACQATSMWVLDPASLGKTHNAVKMGESSGSIPTMSHQPNGLEDPWVWILPPTPH